MAIVTRNIKTVNGLEAKLTTIESNISTNTTSLATVIGTGLGSVDKALVDAKAYADTLVSNVDLSQVELNKNGLIKLNADASTTGSVAKAVAGGVTLSGTNADTKISDYNTATVTPISELLNTVNGDSSTVGSFRKEISDVVGVAPEALDTLAEIATSLGNDADLKTTLENLITTNIANAKAELKGTVSTAMDTMGEIETAFSTMNTTITNNATASTDANTTLQNNIDTLTSSKLAKASNLSDLTDTTTARTNLDVYSKAEIATEITTAVATVPTIKTEALVIDGDVITPTSAFLTSTDLTKILNFGFVRIVVGSDSYDVSVSLEVINSAATGKLVLGTDSADQFDTETANIQYMAV